MSSITTRMKELSLNESESSPARSEPSWQVATTSVTQQPNGTQRRFYRRLNTNPTRVNPRPLPTIEECRAARKTCMYYGFYAGEFAIQKMLINCFPEELKGRDPSDINLFIAATQFIRDVTNRHDIGIHIAYGAQRNKDAIPCIGVPVGDPTFIVGLFPLKREAYMNRITQENVDMLAELLGTKPSWWEIAEFTGL